MRKFYAEAHGGALAPTWSTYTTQDEATSIARTYAIQRSRSGAKLAYATVREFCGEPGDKHVWTVKAVNGRIEQEAHHI